MYELKILQKAALGLFFLKAGFFIPTSFRYRIYLAQSPIYKFFGSLKNAIEHTGLTSHENTQNWFLVRHEVITGWLMDGSEKYHALNRCGRTRHARRQP